MANFQVRFDQTWLGETIYNVTYWQLPGSDEAALEAYADAVRASFVTHILSMMSDDWSLDSLTVRQMDGGLPFSQLVGFTLGQLVGGATGENLARQTALLVSTAALAGRPNRGRLYFGGLTEFTNTALGNAQATHVDAFEAMVLDWANGLTTAVGDAFLRIARPNFLTNLWTASNAVSFVSGRTIWATQRRRRPGVGV